MKLTIDVSSFPPELQRFMVRMKQHTDAGHTLEVFAGSMSFVESELQYTNAVALGRENLLLAMTDLRMKIERVVPGLDDQISVALARAQNQSRN